MAKLLGQFSNTAWAGQTGEHKHRVFPSRLQSLWAYSYNEIQFYTNWVIQYYQRNSIAAIENSNAVHYFTNIEHAFHNICITFLSPGEH